MDIHGTFYAYFPPLPELSRWRPRIVAALRQQLENMGRPDSTLAQQTV